MPDTCQDPSGTGCTEPLKKSSGNSACLTAIQFPFVPIGTLSFSLPTSLHKGSVCYTTNQQSHISVPQYQNQQQVWGDFSLLDEGEMSGSYPCWITQTQKKNPLNCYHKQHFCTENPYTAHIGCTHT